MESEIDRINVQIFEQITFLKEKISTSFCQKEGEDCCHNLSLYPPKLNLELSQ